MVGFGRMFGPGPKHHGWSWPLGADDAGMIGFATGYVDPVAHLAIMVRVALLVIFVLLYPNFNRVAGPPYFGAVGAVRHHRRGPAGAVAWLQLRHAAVVHDIALAAVRDDSDGHHGRGAVDFLEQQRWFGNHALHH